MKNLSFDHVHYRYSDAERTRQFYVEIMGGIEENPLELGGTLNLQFKLGGVTLLFAPANDPSTVAVPAETRLGVYHIAFLVDDCEEATNYFRKRKATVAIEPFCASESIKASFLCAPDGMWVELKENLSADKTPCQGPDKPSITGVCS